MVDFPDFQKKLQILTILHVPRKFAPSPFRDSPAAITLTALFAYIHPWPVRTKTSCFENYVYDIMYTVCNYLTFP